MSDVEWTLAYRNLSRELASVRAERDAYGEKLALAEAAKEILQEEVAKVRAERDSLRGKFLKMQAEHKRLRTVIERMTLALDGRVHDEYGYWVYQTKRKTWVDGDVVFGIRQALDVAAKALRWDATEINIRALERIREALGQTESDDA